MRLLIDCMPLTVGGGVQVAIALLENLFSCADVAWQAVLPTKMQPALPEHLINDQRIIYLKKKRHTDRIWLRGKLLLLEQAFKPDVVFSVFGPAYFQARAPHLVGFALPNLIYERDADVASPNKILEPILDWARCASFKKADHLVVETKTVKTRLISRLEISGNVISVIHNSVNPLLTHPEPKVLSKDGANPFVFFVPSAYYKHKNLEIIPDVAAQIEQLNPKFDFVFHMTLHQHAPAWQMLSLKAASLGVQKRVKTLGVLPITALGQAYNNASAVYLPTLREASTAVYPESFHFNRPLITSDMDFARGLCGDAAIYVDPKNAKATASALIALAANPERIAELVACAKHQLQTTYPTSREKFIQQLELLHTLACRSNDKNALRPD
jgi:glycosyltransferase involved in cell wall biosynthesis